MARQRARCPIPEAFRFPHEAMATVFEILLVEPDHRYAEQAAWAAFEELDRLERELSRYVSGSDISRVNSARADVPVRVGPAAFDCLELAARVHQETRGAFDVTVGALLACRGAKGAPSEGELRAAERVTGMELVQLDRATHTVRKTMAGVSIDLGGIGKGYAVDRLAASLSTWSVECAVINGGRSSVLALEAPPGKKGWPLEIAALGREGPCDLVHLRRAALGASALGKPPHIIDPRSGKPVREARSAWAHAGTAALADALSTAFAIMDSREVKDYCARHADAGALLAAGEGSARRVLRFGRWPPA